MWGGTKKLGDCGVQKLRFMHFNKVTETGVKGC
jgi:hypothetical protein